MAAQDAHTGAVTAWIKEFRAGARNSAWIEISGRPPETRMNKGFQGRCPENIRFSVIPLNPLWIGYFRAGSSETLINKGLTGRVFGDALNTRASGHILGGALNTRASSHLFLEMGLRFRTRIFPILSLSGRCSETRADKGLQSRVSGDALFIRGSEHPFRKCPKYTG